MKILSRYQENEDEEDIDGERDLDNILEIVKVWYKMILW